MNGQEIWEFVIVNGLMAVAVLVSPLLVAWQGRESAKPNRYAGIRTEKTSVDATTWQAGHRAALPAIRFGGLLAFVFAGGGVVTGLFGWQGLTMICALCAGATAFIAFGVGVARANTAAEKVSEEQSQKTPSSDDAPADDASAPEAD